MEIYSLPVLAKQLPRSMESSRTSISEEERLERKVLWLNEEPGKLTGYNCPLCKNRGDIASAINGEIVWRPCKCLKIRGCLKNIRESGLGPLLKNYTFGSYRVREEWQRAALEKVLEYTRGKTGAWLLLSGCTGAGKTHLCTAACGELLKNGVEVRYMLWVDESQRLKSAKTDAGYEKLMRPWKQADVLYVDDLFKTNKGENPSDADIRLAFELINARYIDSRKRTIISSERTLEEIIDLDRALGGRLRQRVDGFYVKFSGKKDWRLL